jgi:hypothetical protein
MLLMLQIIYILNESLCSRVRTSDKNVLMVILISFSYIIEELQSQKR